MNPYPFTPHYTLLSFYYFYLEKNNLPTLWETRLIVYSFSCVFTLTASSPWEIMVMCRGSRPAMTGAASPVPRAPPKPAGREGALGAGGVTVTVRRGSSLLLAEQLPGVTLLRVPDQGSYVLVTPGRTVNTAPPGAALELRPSGEGDGPYRRGCAEEAGGGWFGFQYRFKTEKYLLAREQDQYILSVNFLR